MYPPNDNHSRIVIVTDIITTLFIVLFVYAAISKLLDYEKFTIQIGQSPLLTGFAEPLAWLVPAIELGAAALLISTRYRLAGLYLSFILMVVFTCYIVIVTRFSEYVPCSCGGVLEKLSWNEHLVFNLVFVVLGIVSIVFYPKAPTERPAA